MLYLQRSTNKASCFPFVPIPQDFMLRPWRTAKTKDLFFSLGAMTRHFKLHPWRSAKKVFYSSLGARHQDPERILFLSWRKASSLQQHLFFSWRDASRHQNHFNYSIDSTLELHTSFLALSIKHFIFLLV